MPPLIERDSFPYLFVFVLGSWRRLFILRLYGSVKECPVGHRPRHAEEIRGIGRSWF